MGRSSSVRTHVIAIGAALCSGAAAPALAHHSLAPYDRGVSRTIEGVVKTYEFVNPHVKLSLTVTNANGSVTAWFFESGSVSRMAMRGFNRVSARVGEKITVHYNPRRNGSAGGYLTGFTDAEGRFYGPIQER
jgi:hypothetical protein